MGSEFEIVEHSKSSGFQVEIISSITSIALPSCLPLFCSLLRLFVIVIYGQKDNRRLLMESKIQFKISNELLSENGVGEKSVFYNGRRCRGSGGECVVKMRYIANILLIV